ncbi:MAG: zinc-dependent metalloprotease family protein [Luminiphilus sp.]|nr:zinc-dependent metalloprotease family protein [Luminiphilus sp.]
MTREWLGVRVLTRICLIVFMVMAAMVVKAEQRVAFFKIESSDAQHNLVTQEDFRLALGDRLAIRTPHEPDLYVSVKRSYISKLGNRVISGGVANGNNFVLAIDKHGVVSGFVNDKFESFQISGSLGDLSLLREMQSSEFPLIDAGAIATTERQDSSKARLQTNWNQELNRKPPSRSAFGSAQLKADTEVEYPVFTATPVIDILFFYDENLPNPLLAIDQSIEYSNAIYSNTNMNMSLNLVAAVPISIDSDLNNSDLLQAMRDSAEPFEALTTLRSEYQADLIHTLRVDKVDRDEGNCGIASYSVLFGRGFRYNATAVTEWDRCKVKAVGHELGHNLGAAHNRENYENEVNPAYAYSFGKVRPGVFSTLMGQGSNGGVFLDTFSDPSSSCYGVPCGNAPSEAGSADNRRTLMNSARIVSSFEGANFDPASIQFWPFTSNWCEGDVGYRSHAVKNSSPYDISIRKRVFLNGDGGVFTSREYETGQFIVKSGKDNGSGYCDTTADQPFGDDIRESYFVYENPVTGRLVEGTHIFWDDNYEGDYGIVRAAAGAGGSVVGHPSIHARVDAEVEITFEPDFGYKLHEVTGTCPGSLHYHVYTAEPLYGDCWAVASFRPLESNERVQQHFNNLLDIVMFGRGG